MALQLRRAERKKAKLKIGISAISGAGKTTGSLLFAYGLLKGEHPEWTDEQVWDKIAIIDSENGSGEIYCNSKVKGTPYYIGQYWTIPLQAPFTCEKYIEAINMCKEAGMEVCIIDSMTHLWNGVGSLLEKQGNIAQRSGNSYTAWRSITPEYNRFLDTMLQVDMHIIGTMRSKTEYSQEKNADGKTVIRKVGMSPIMRDGIEFEFTLFMDIDADHQAHVTKDRTGVLSDDFFVIEPKEGIKIAEWLNSGAEMIDNEMAMKKASPESANNKTEVPVSNNEINDKHDELKSLIDSVISSGVKREDVAATIKKHYIVNGKPSANYTNIKDVSILDAIIEDVKGLVK